MTDTVRAHYLNGRILLRDHGGVRRYAREVANRLSDCHTLQPRAAPGPWSGRIWEQTTLAKQSADGVLLNLAHSGPRHHPRQVSLIHDLLALTHPESVHPAYAALVRLHLPRHIAAASKLLAVSSHVADQLADRFDRERSSIRVVPPGISDVFRPGDQAAARRHLGLDANRPVAAALLDPTPRKRSDLVAHILKRVQQAHPETQIVVAGKPRPPRFGRQRGALPIDRSRFTDLGAAPDPELAALYQSADVFLSLPSGEGFGLPAIEAAYCGAAVVTTPVPSITEHCPGGAKLVTNPADATAAVLGLLEDQNSRHQLATTAQKTLGDLQWTQTAASLGIIMTEAAQQ